MKAPEGVSFVDLKPILPIFLTYILSFVYGGIYWNNHHHLLHAVKQINGEILWANLNLVFWLPLLPFVTGWMGKNYFTITPTVFLYGAVLFIAALSFKIVVHFVIKNEGKDSAVGEVYSSGNRLDGSLLLYFIGIVLSFLSPLISVVIYLIVALIWFIPDKRVERTLKEYPHETENA